MCYPKQYIKVYAALCCILCSLSLYGQQPVGLNDSFEKLLNELDQRLAQTDLYEKKHLGEIQKTKILQTNARTLRKESCKPGFWWNIFFFISLTHACTTWIRQSDWPGNKTTRVRKIR